MNSLFLIVPINRFLVFRIINLFWRNNTRTGKDVSSMEWERVLIYEMGMSLKTYGKEMCSIYIFYIYTCVLLEWKCVLIEWEYSPHISQ